MQNIKANKLGIRVVNDIDYYCYYNSPSYIIHNNGYYYNNKNRVINYRRYGIMLWKRIR
jgi:hypothetical protein